MASSSLLEPATAAPPCAQRTPSVVAWPAQAIAHAQGERWAPHVCDCEQAAGRWRVVDVDLSEVIGRRGTAAVLRRALAMARRTHGWLPVPAPDAEFDACMRALTCALADRRPEDCSAGRRALEATFHELLSTLLGVELTGQLLQASLAAHPAANTPVP